MKSCYHYALFAAFLGAVTQPTLAQTEVPILITKETYVVEFKPPFTTLKVNIDDDVNDYYSLLPVTDSTLVFRSASEKRDYARLLEKRLRDIERENERQEKAKAKGKPLDDVKVFPPVDKTPYYKNHELLRPGMEIQVLFNEYRYSKRFVIQEITVLTDLEGSGKVDGTFEQLDGDVATVDGQAMRLKPGAEIVGEQGYKGQKFKSFGAMEKGMELRVKGKRQPDGTLLVESGTVQPDQFTEVDGRLVNTLKLTKKLTGDGGEVAFGNARFKLLQDSKVNAYVNRLGKKLVPDHIKKLDPNNPTYVDFNFFVVIDSTFNACAYPDGSVFVHTQLLNEVENEAQLAAVLGHEIAHVTYRHGRQEYRNNQRLGGLKTGLVSSTAVAALYNLDVKDLGTMAVAFGGGPLSSYYGRKLENQADRVGLSYMFDAGYDPREAPKLWSKLRTKTLGAPEKSLFDKILEVAPSVVNVVQAANNGNIAVGDVYKTTITVFDKYIESIYASHPSAGRRYKNLNATIVRNYQDVRLDSLAKGEPEFRTIQKRVQRIVRGKDPDDPNADAELPGQTGKPADTKKIIRKPAKPAPPKKKKS